MLGHSPDIQMPSQIDGCVVGPYPYDEGEVKCCVPIIDRNVELSTRDSLVLGSAL